MYYKQMMGFANVDTEATISLTRQQLDTLDVKMIELNSDIPVFNSHVQELLSKLHQHDTTSEDTLTNLFRGYRAAQDTNFHSFILDIERKFLYGIDQVTAHTKGSHGIPGGKGQGNLGSTLGGAADTPSSAGRGEKLKGCKSTSEEQ